MDDRKIEGLLTTVRAGSFNKAADILGCTQSSMTQMMKGLESELGCQIFVRSHSGVRLSRTGERLFPYFQQAGDSFAQLRRAAARTAAGAGSVIRIGTFNSFSKNWLPAVIRDFRKEHPNAVLKIRVGATEVLDWLKNGEIDLALIDASKRGGFRWFPLFEDPLMAVIPESQALAGRESASLDELMQFPLILSPYNEPQEVIDRVSSLRDQEPLRLDSNDDETLLSMIAQGLGAAVLPTLSLHRNVEHIRILPLDPPMSRTVGAALSRTAGMGSADFLQFLRSAEIPEGTHRPEGGKKNR